MFLDIFRAIEHRHLIQMRYANYYRVVEPYVYGNVRGVDMLRAYQLAGSDGINGDVGWKWFNAGEIEGIVVLSTRFHQERTGVTFLPGEMRRVYCQIGA